MRTSVESLKDIARRLRVCVYRSARAVKERGVRDNITGRPEGRFFSDTGHQVFFGYYDISPFSTDERYMLAMQAPPENLPPGPDTRVKVGYYDLHREDQRFVEVGNSETWCWQQGCRLRWYPREPGRAIMYNRLVDGGYGCVVQNIESGEIVKSFKRPFYDVSRDGRWGLSLNFSRLHRVRPGYGYVNRPDKTVDELRPKTDGIWRVDLETGEEKLLFSISEIASFNPLFSMKNAEHYFNHILFNPAGTRFMFFHLWLNKGKRFIRLITCDIEGNDRYALVNEGHVSHYIWKSDHEILAYSTHADTGVNYHLYEDKTNKKTIIGKGMLTQDGHPSFSPDGSLLLVDTYPDKYREQHLLVFRLDTEELRNLGSFFVPFKFKGELRCDLHPRWSPSGRYICFDSVLLSGRAIQIFDLKSLS